MDEQQISHDEHEAYVCGECGADVLREEEVCPKCGADVSEIQEDELQDSSRIITTGRYPALMTIAGIYQALAWLIATAGAIGVILALSNIDDLEGKILLISSVIGGVIGCITFLAASESIRVFIDIEENTRTTAQYVSERTESKE